MLNIITLETGPLQVNTYLVWDPDFECCVIVDPGGTEGVEEALRTSGKKCSHILLTHAHYDHIGGAGTVRDWTGAELCILDKEETSLRNQNMNLSALMGSSALKELYADRILADGEILNAAGLSFEVIACPGHTPGGASFYLRGHKALFCGDTLFKRSFGRTDLPGGNMQNLKDTIVNRLFPLDGDTIVYPGHGEKTIISEERIWNPIVSRRSFFL